MLIKKLSKKPRTLSQKVTELIASENGLKSSDESEGETALKIVEFDDEYSVPDGRSTDIRKRNVKLLSEQSAKYRGKISSRKDFEFAEENASNAETSDESDFDEEGLRAFNGELQKSTYDSDGSSSEVQSDTNDKEIGRDDDGVDDDSYDTGEEEEEDDNDDAEDDVSKIVNETNCQAEIQKGQSVQNQLRIWERLLELRIHSQKLVVKANLLPSSNKLKSMQTESEELKHLAEESSRKLSKLLNSTLQLQKALVHQYPEIKSATKESLKRPANFESELMPPLKRFSNRISLNFNTFKNYRNEVLLKWDDRTKLLTPGAGAKKKSINDEFDILQKIDNALSNKEALIEKSRTLKNGTPSEGVAGSVYAAGATPDTQIYDDSDFYHQQLRELIEYKANTTSNIREVTKQYVELQKLRQQMKKKVDTRASKGRKLRYTVHNKLVNFMAPDNSLITWTDESTIELSKSLFAL